MIATQGPRFRFLLDLNGTIPPHSIFMRCGFSWVLGGNGIKVVCSLAFKERYVDRLRHLHVLLGELQDTAKDVGLLETGYQAIKLMRVLGTLGLCSCLNWNS